MINAAVQKEVAISTGMFNLYSKSEYSIVIYIFKSVKALIINFINKINVDKWL